MVGEVFKKLKSSVNRGITTITVKTSSSLEKTKIKTYIESLDNEIQHMLLWAGEKSFSIWQSGDGNYEPLINHFTAIQQKKAEIERLTDELSVIDEKNRQILGNSKQETHVDSRNNKFICTNCGSQYDISVNFCRKCGHKLQVP